MHYFYTALKMHGYTPKDVLHLKGDEGIKRLALLYKSTLTACTMDSKQVCMPRHVSFKI